MIEVGVRITDACAAKLDLGDAASACESYEQNEGVDYTCTTSPELCECKTVTGPITVDEALAFEPNAYETSGSELTLTTPSGEAVAYSYCISDDTLVLGSAIPDRHPYVVFVRD